MNRNFRQLEIVEEIITIASCGPSLLLLSDEDLRTLRKDSFMMFINFGFRTHPKYADACIWSDTFTGIHYERNYPRNSAPFVSIAREECLRQNIDEVDFVFSPRKDKLRGNFTFTHTLELVQKYFPEKYILLFGLDLSAREGCNGHSYDDLVPEARLSVERLEKDFNNIKYQLDNYIENKRIINCNTNSNYNRFPKVNYKRLLTNGRLDPRRIRRNRK